MARAAIEGTSVPLELIRRYARKGPPTVEFRDDRRFVGLAVTRRTEYFGFELDRSRQPLEGTVPPELAEQARDALAQAVVEDLTPHPDQRKITRAVTRVDEYWRRSGGRLKEASPEARLKAIRAQLSSVNDWPSFVGTRLELDPEVVVPEATRASLDALPSSVQLDGDRVALSYEMENGNAVAVIHLREGQARRLRKGSLPPVDRPMRFAITHGRSVFRAESIDEAVRALRSLPREREPKHGKHRRNKRRR